MQINISVVPILIVVAVMVLANQLSPTRQLQLPDILVPWVACNRWVQVGMVLIPMLVLYWSHDPILSSLIAWVVVDLLFNADEQYYNIRRNEVRMGGLHTQSANLDVPVGSSMNMSLEDTIATEFRDAAMQSSSFMLTSRHAMKDLNDADGDDA